jgi:ParB-like chromosome segregation protein Spo0J
VDAARKAGLKEIPVEIEELSDSDMLMRMTRENLRGELLVSLEAVSAAVKAFAAGAVVFEKADAKTNTSVLRYAPSFVPGKTPSDASGASHAYTADTLARFLGGVYVKPDKCAQDGVRAALGILEMEEHKVVGFSEQVLRIQKETEGDEKEEPRYLGAKKIIAIVSDVKKREVFDKAKTEKRAEEVDKYNTKQLALQTSIREHEEAARLVQQALLKKQLDAKAEEDEKEIKRLGERMREQAANARLKAIADSEKLQALEQKVAAAKLKAEEAKKVDEYASVRRDVERFLFKLSNVSTGSICEEVKTLSRLPLNVNDRERLRQASLTLGTWYCEWVAAQFVPPLNGKKELKEMKSREVANRKAEEAKARAAEEIARKERVAAKAVAAKAAKAAKKKETK